MKIMNYSVLETKKVVGNFKMETYSFKCGVEFTNKLKGISKPFSKNLKFEEYRKCSEGEKYQEGCYN